MVSPAPPSDLKTIIDKTATFVARNGPEFESRIKNEQNNAKFSFLQPNDPFHAYYRAKVAEVGAQPILEAVAATALTPAIEGNKRHSTITSVEPPKLLHTGLKPVGAHSLDLDVIQLTAQFVAANGRAFLTGIANRESKNPQVCALLSSESPLFPSAVVGVMCVLPTSSRSTTHIS